MHHMVTTEHPAKRRPRKRIQNCDPLPGTGEKSRALRRAAVRRLQDQSTPTSPQPLTRPVKPGNRLAGPSSEPEKLADPPRQRRIEFSRKIGGYDDRATRSPGESTPQASLGASGF